MSHSEPPLGPSPTNRRRRAGGRVRSVVPRPPGEPLPTTVPPGQPNPIPMRYRVKGWAPQDINPQLACPLYNGYIPPEIRNIIFELALTETTTPYLEHDVDLDVRYDHAPSGDAALAAHEGPPVPEFKFPSEDGANGMDWLRPGYKGPKRLSCQLLRTCRRVYLETEHLPHLMKEHVLFCGREPPWATSYSSARAVCDYFTYTLPREVASRVRELHLIPQMFWLERNLIRLGQLSSVEKMKKAQKAASMMAEGKVLPTRGAERVLDKLEKLHITLRARDFWWNENFTPPCLNPFEDTNKRSITPDFQRMYADMATAKKALDAGALPQQSPTWDAWGMTFAHMPALTTLVIDFEAVEERVQEMEAIIAWARTWRFEVLNNPSTRFLTRCTGPSKGNTAEANLSTLDGKPVRRSWLSAENAAVKKMSWRGRPYHLAQTCPECSSRTTTEGCGYCRKRARLNEQGKGPRLYVWTLTWRAYPEKLDEGNIEPVLAGSCAGKAEAGQSTDTTVNSNDANAEGPLTVSQVERLAAEDQDGWSVYF